MSLATGIRLGGGYIWAGYTGVFYSSLFIQQSSSGDDTLTLSSSSSCSYSYNSNNANTTATATAAVYSSAGVCSADYPYCVDGTCSALNGYPWHNVGMQSIQLEVRSTLFMYASMYMYVCISMCVYVCMYAFIYVCMYVYVCTCIYLCIYLHVCMYVCMYMQSYWYNLFVYTYICGYKILRMYCMYVWSVIRSTWHGFRWWGRAWVR